MRDDDIRLVIVRLQGGGIAENARRVLRRVRARTDLHGHLFAQPRADLVHAADQGVEIGRADGHKDHQKSLPA